MQEELPVIANFEVRRRAYLAPDGGVLRHLPDFANDRDLIISMYRGMALARAFDLRAVSLQRTGRLGTYATSLGQEAVTVGIASAMRPEDVLLPSYRDNAALLWRGVRWSTPPTKPLKLSPVRQQNSAARDPSSAYRCSRTRR
jgi:2-oxoisovalerate dehydrogenase E1 component alpha subunit